MENSFFEYRNDTTDKLDSDSDGIIDNSFSTPNNVDLQKKLISSAKKNKTVYVAETDDSDMTSDTDSEEMPKIKKSTKSKPIRAIESSDEDSSRRGSIRRPSGDSSQVIVDSTDDDDSPEASPEMIPRRRLTKKSNGSKSSDSPLIRKVKKRIMQLTDSEHENSIVIEKEKHTKQICIKDTPLKIDQNGTVELDSSTAHLNLDETSCDVPETGVPGTEVRNSKSSSPVSKADSAVANSLNLTDDDEDGMFEEQLVMSKATRMSIMGVVPPGSDSDSDFIQSDESTRNSKENITNEIDNSNSLPDVVEISRTPVKAVNDETDNSRLSCSPFASPTPKSPEGATSPILASTKPVHENEKSFKKSSQEVECFPVAFAMPRASGPRVVKQGRSNQIVYDDDVTIIDNEPEIIALSSDDEEKSPLSKTSPKPRKSVAKEPTTSNRRTNTMKDYLGPPLSYPNQVVYVKKHVRENELSKLNSLQEELHNIKHLLDNMDVSTLPDGGARLATRLSQLEAAVRTQGDKVAAMLVEPEAPTPAQMAADGFSREPLSWEQLQLASNQVQPKTHGKQAVATHEAERSLITQRLRDLYESLATRPSESELAVPPRAMRSELMPHQLHALAWLRWRETQRPPAGILADDMGLGKTITMIALIASDKESNIDDDDSDDDQWQGKGNNRKLKAGTLVVCPASLLEQWGQEVQKHCGAHALSVLLHHGTNRATQASRLATYDIVVTTYSLIIRDSSGVLSRLQWRRIILDEAHVVRNHKSQTCAGVTSLPGRRRWCLTGTPVQNKDLDVFALLKFMRCTPFDDLTMWKKWIDNKSAGGQERLSTIMRGLLLRRTKDQLQAKGQLNCLPDREEKDITVTLDQAEMNVYQKVLVFSKTLFAQFLHQRAEKQSDMSPGFLPKPGKDDEFAKMHKKMVALQGAKPVKSHEILVLLLRLRQVCCHCGLIASTLDGDETAEPDAAGVDLLKELDKLSLNDSKRKSGGNREDPELPPEEGTSVAEAIRSVLSPNNPVFNLSRQSSKIKAVMECLHQDVFVNPGHKAVVVSQWTSVLRLVEAELNKAKIKSVTLSGQVPVPHRPPLINALNDPKSNVKVMLLSLCAGGVGLNLCGANHLLLLDPHWNPQLERQAQDRVYRVGQKNPVTIYRFLCADTVEASIRRLQDSKIALADAVLTGAKPTQRSQLSIDDLKMLFNMPS